MKITAIDYVKFVGQVLFQSTAKLATAIVGLPLIAFALFFIEKPKKHPFYSFVKIQHTPHYIDKGSSGTWEYWQLPDWWILKPYRNLNYGLLGEYYGRWSALREGDERSYFSMFRQCALRNPANGLRYMDLFSCQVDNCDIAYKGAYGPLQVKYNLNPGWNFVKGKDRDTGRCYYSFQYVRGIGDNHGFRIRIGFKIEPSHIERGDIKESKERATFTLRVNPYKEVNPFKK